MRTYSRRTLGLTNFWRHDPQVLEHIIPPRGGEFPDAAALALLINMVGDGRALEFGCGRGRLARLFDSDLYHGVDISSHAIEAAVETHPDYEFSVIEPYADLPETEIVFGVHVLLHIPDDLIDVMVAKLAACAERVIVCEIMNAEFSDEIFWPPAMNRDVETYDALFEDCGMSQQQSRAVSCDCYKHQKITVAEYG